MSKSRLFRTGTVKCSGGARRRTNATLSPPRLSALGPAENLTSRTNAPAWPPPVSPPQGAILTLRSG
eukprot:CAMPEP_0117600776 /NCGR_PEP_ID=MMETSP0784-20121206/76676_1 /TAXON_ID=39447 /ORGANISM="" /LENGTH=66 /DNA_ID=CAMNT_0005403447 /DNA_START=67 /DNA_END=263 /DNA_ORIENTATION=-